MLGGFCRIPYLRQISLPVDRDSAEQLNSVTAFLYIYAVHDTVRALAGQNSSGGCSQSPFKGRNTEGIAAKVK